MKPDHPTLEEQAQLLQLWKQVFGDHGGFWEMFLDTGFDPDHCRCVTEGTQVTAALYWFDGFRGGQKIAYLYAVVTHPEHRGKGLCRGLMEDTHAFLADHGYASAILVPEKEELRDLYRKLGYRDCTCVSEFSCAAGDTPVSMRAIGLSEYAALRRRYLPENGVIQEGNNLDFLAAQVQFYTGEDWLMAAYAEEETLYAPELLGNADAAPGIVSALNCIIGKFRTPGAGRNFAMFRPLRADAVAPSYFGFAFD